MQVRKMDGRVYQRRIEVVQRLWETEDAYARCAATAILAGHEDLAKRFAADSERIHDLAIRVMKLNPNNADAR